VLTAPLSISRALKQQLWDAQILQWEAQKRSELYKKFFVGNLKWTDITIEGTAHRQRRTLALVDVLIVSSSSSLSLSLSYANTRSPMATRLRYGIGDGGGVCTPEALGPAPRGVGLIRAHRPRQGALGQALCLCCLRGTRTYALPSLPIPISLLRAAAAAMINVDLTHTRTRQR
jgi:hypothetical protein